MFLSHPFHRFPYRHPQTFRRQIKISFLDTANQMCYNKTIINISRRENNSMDQYNTEYRNVYVQNDAEPVFCYRTGLTVYEESFTDELSLPADGTARGILSTCCKTTPHVCIPYTSLSRRLSSSISTANTAIWGSNMSISPPPMRTVTRTRS